MPIIDTFVCVDDKNIYPARVNPAVRWNGWVSPAFTLDVVRSIAADTAAAAEEYGHDCIDTIHVIEGTTGKAGAETVVLRVSWQYLEDEGPASAVQIIRPDAEGLYHVGGFDWTWYIVDDPALTTAQWAAEEARARVLAEATRAAGEVLRKQRPDVTAMAVQIAEGTRPRARVRVVYAADGPTAIEQATGVPVEMLAEADDILTGALRFGMPEEHELRAARWRPVSVASLSLYRIPVTSASRLPATEPAQ